MASSQVAIVRSCPNSLKSVALPAYVSAFLATADGLALAKAFTGLRDAKLRRSVVDLVKEIAGDGQL